MNRNTKNCHQEPGTSRSVDEVSSKEDIWVLLEIPYLDSCYYSMYASTEAVQTFHMVEVYLLPESETNQNKLN